MNRRCNELVVVVVCMLVGVARADGKRAMRPADLVDIRAEGHVRSKMRSDGES
jgi:hypothetical protein